MSVVRWCAVTVCLCLAPPVAAQGGADRGSAASGHPAASRPQAAREASQPDVVVNGIIDKKPGTWKRAESEHVIVLSKGSAGDLTRITNNLERLYHLLSRFYRRGGQPDETAKLQVTLIDSPAAFSAMELRNLRSEEGPYLAAFPDRTYYDPREDGEVLAIARNDQIIDLNTNRAYNLDCDDALANGAWQCAGNAVYHPPAGRTWEELLYSAFAQRFVLTADPAAYPRWYLDGVGALFSTIRVRGNGAIDYALPPLEYKQVLRSYGDLNVGDILAGRYLDAVSKKTSWSPYHAWLLAHYFLFSNLKPERSRQFRDYMTAIHRGEPMAEAAKLFGDMGKLQREVARYAAGKKSFARADPPEGVAGDPMITMLSPGSAALVEARVELGTRLPALPADAGAGAAAVAPTEAQRRTDWLKQVRDTVAGLPYDSEALLFAAEAECRSGHDGECLAAAERVLAGSPDNIRALAWKGVALTDQAVAGPAAERSNILAVARKTIEHAIELDGDAPLPLIAWFQSFTKAGERVPDQAMLGMARVIRSVPAAPAPRLYLAEELLRQGKPDLARRVVYTLLYGAYDSPEKTAAQALFSPPGGPPPA
ncbi:MAG: hypothetical protein JWN66_2068 [Sphingomonas bacterium]|uniref:tetratricopeptide repeat protein n=1 Tax=Sphingomonas bacterium TaxID=1895847 RepID=UPI00262ACAB4|nr:hypothetical protein [Sphingomonas bacterium]MDB5704952.1 hypothetical protein [Sphingomonas bacterium]